MCRLHISIGINPMEWDIRTEIFAKDIKLYRTLLPSIKSVPLPQESAFVFIPML